MYYWIRNNEDFKNECKNSFIESILTKSRNVNSQFARDFAYYFDIDVAQCMRRAKRYKKKDIYVKEEEEIPAEFYEQLEKEEEKRALAELERID